METRDNLLRFILEFSITFFFMNIIMQVLAIILNSFSFLKRTLSGLLTFFLIYYGLFTVLLVLLILLVRRGKWKISDLGLSKNINFNKDIKYGVITFSIVILIITPIYPFIISSYATRTGSISTLLSRNPMFLVIFLLLYTIITLIEAPIHEEIFYRGYYQGFLNEITEDAVAIISSGIFFGIVHAIFHPDWPPEFLIIPIVCGFIFGITYWWTKSLIPTIVAHFLINYLLVFPPAIYKDGFIVESYIFFGTIVFVSILTVFRWKKEALEMLNNAYQELSQLTLKNIFVFLIVAFLTLIIAEGIRILVLIIF